MGNPQETTPILQKNLDKDVVIAGWFHTVINNEAFYALGKQALIEQIGEEILEKNK